MQAVYDIIYDYKIGFTCKDSSLNLGFDGLSKGDRQPERSQGRLDTQKATSRVDSSIYTLDKVCFISIYVVKRKHVHAA